MPTQSLLLSTTGWRNRLTALNADPGIETGINASTDTLHGARCFLTDTRFPERAIYVNTGQDGTMFDDTSITLQ